MILMTLVGSWMFCCNRACWLLLMAPQPSPKVLLWVAETSQLNPFQSHPRMPALWNKTTWIYHDIPGSSMTMLLYYQHTLR
jgi:hypothetical protein